MTQEKKKFRGCIPYKYVAYRITGVFNLFFAPCYLHAQLTLTIILSLRHGRGCGSSLDSQRVRAEDVTEGEAIPQPQNRHVSQLDLTWQANLISHMPAR